MKHSREYELDSISQQDKRIIQRWNFLGGTILTLIALICFLPARILFFKALNGVEQIVVWCWGHWLPVLCLVPLYFFQKYAFSKAQIIKTRAFLNAKPWYSPNEALLHLKTNRDVYQIELLNLKKIQELDVWFSAAGDLPLEIQMVAIEDLVGPFSETEKPQTDNTPAKIPTNREEHLMRLLNFQTVDDLEAWLNSPSELSNFPSVCDFEDLDNELD